MPDIFRGTLRKREEEAGLEEPVVVKTKAGPPPATAPASMTMSQSQFGKPLTDAERKKQSDALAKALRDRENRGE